MKSLFCLFACVALLLCSRPGVAQVQIRPLPEPKPAKALPLGAQELNAADASQWLDQLLGPALQRQRISAVVVVVVKDGQVLLSRGYGVADRASGKPVDPAATLFRAGSIAKTITWTAVMQLVEQGRLDLDADVNRYLDFSIPPYQGQPLTLRQLMTHSAGFEEVEKDPVLSPAAASSPDWFAQWVKRSLPRRIYPPGELPAYSNYGAALAGYIVQRVSGQGYEDYVEQHVFRPLGMQHASFREPLPPALQTDLAASYAPGGSTPQPFQIRAALPAGGLSASGEDMGRFMLAHLQDGRYGDARILQPASARLMREYAYQAVPGLLPGALGFFRMDRNGRFVVGHRGDLPFFHSAMVLYPQEQVGLYVSIDGTAGVGLRRHLLDGFADRYFPPLPQRPPPTLASAREHGQLLVGNYLSSRASRANFSSAWNLLPQVRVLMAADGSLITPSFHDAGGKPRHWREVQPYLWLDDVDGSHLGARIRDGRLLWMSTDAHAPETVFLPLPAWQSPAWNLPLLAAALLVLLLAALAWPVGVAVRRWQVRPPLLHGAMPLARWRRRSQAVAWLYLALAAGWIALLHQSPTSALDPWLRLLQLFGVLAVLGLIPVAIHVVQAWRGQGGWVWRIAGVALLLACAAGTWFIFSLHLLTWRLNY